MECNRQNFLSFWTVFCLFTPLTTRKITILKKWTKRLEILSFYTYVPKMTIIWCMVPEISRRTEFFVILDYFLLFYPPNNQKNQNFENIKKVPGDIIILHKCAINDNHMMYGSWDMKHDGQNFLSFWTVFCPFTTQKIKILKNWKKN